MYTKDDIRRACKLYAVTDDAWLDGRTLADCVNAAVKGGATFVQLRNKQATTQELIEQAQDLLPLCRAAGVPFVIDDNIEAACAAGADGVHVGQSDASCEKARAALGEDAIVGVSVQTCPQARAAEAAGADYLGVGALMATPTKPDATVVSPEVLRKICDTVNIPVVAIGGLNLSTMSCLKDTHVAGAAVVSAIFAAQDIESETHKLLNCIGEIVG